MLGASDEMARKMKLGAPAIKAGKPPEPRSSLVPRPPAMLGSSRRFIQAESYADALQPNANSGRDLAPAYRNKSTSPDSSDRSAMVQLCILNVHLSLMRSRRVESCNCRWIYYNQCSHQKINGIGTRQKQTDFRKPAAAREKRTQFAAELRRREAVQCSCSSLFHRRSGRPPAHYHVLFFKLEAQARAAGFDVEGVCGREE